MTVTLAASLISTTVQLQHIESHSAPCQAVVVADRLSYEEEKLPVSFLQ